MKTISADYNAITESDHLRLSFASSQEDMRNAGVQPGDWAWLSDGEVMVGARIVDDPDEGLVGAPAWDTMVYLDSAEGRSVTAIWSDIQRLLKSPSPSRADNTKLLQLLMQFEEVAPPEIKSVIPPECLPLNRAMALMSLDQPTLALMEIEQALLGQPDEPNLVFFYIEYLRRFDLERAVREATARAEKADVSATILAACINALATHLDVLSNDQFVEASTQLLRWIERFETARGRESVDAFLLATVQFNRGLVLLRRGQVTEAQRAFDIAHRENPVDPGYRKAMDLDAFDQIAIAIAKEVRVLS